jgi:hypothetical protein
MASHVLQSRFSPRDAETNPRDGNQLQLQTAASLLLFVAGGEIPIAQSALGAKNCLIPYGNPDNMM